LYLLVFFVFIRKTKVISSRDKKQKIKTQKGHHDKVSHSTSPGGGAALFLRPHMGPNLRAGEEIKRKQREKE